MTATLPWRWGGLVGKPGRADESAGETPSGHVGLVPDEVAGSVAALDREADAARFGGGNRPTDYVTVYIARSLPEGYVIKGRLEHDDIPSMLRYETLGLNWGVTAMTHGVQVMVPVPLAERAWNLLHEQPKPRRRTRVRRRHRQTPAVDGSGPPATP